MNIKISSSKHVRWEERTEKKAGLFLLLSDRKRIKKKKTASDTTDLLLAKWWVIEASKQEAKNMDKLYGKVENRKTKQKAEYWKMEHD